MDDKKEENLPTATAVALPNIFNPIFMYNLFLIFLFPGDYRIFHVVCFFFPSIFTVSDVSRVSVASSAFFSIPASFFPSLLLLSLLAQYF